jgi:hypothetical protein
LKLTSFSWERIRLICLGRASICWVDFGQASISRGRVSKGRVSRGSRTAGIRVSWTRYYWVSVSGFNVSWSQVQCQLVSIILYGRQFLVNCLPAKSR